MFAFHKCWKLVFLWCLLCYNVKARLHPRFTNSSTPTTTSAISAVGGCDFCIIEAAGGVQLIYWEPDDAAHPSNVTYNAAQPYTQVENGFTFTSPSVYVVYSQLRATPTCNTNVLETIGPSFAAYTLGYSSSFLAYGTLEIPGPGCTESVIAGGFHTINFSSLYYNPIVPTTSSKPGCPPWVNPRISMATGLQNVDPSWATCQPFFAGAYDPPSVLKKQSQLAPPPAAGAGPVTDNGPVATAIPAQAPAAPTADAPAVTSAADPGNNPQSPAPAPAPADPGSAPGNPPAAPAPNPQQAPANSPNAPQDKPGNQPASPPAAPAPNPQQAPANSPNAPQDRPGNQPASPPAAPAPNPQQAPANSPNAPQDKPGNQPASPPAAPAPNPQQAPANSPNTPQDKPGNQPASPPAAPKADTINAVANPVAQIKTNPQNAPPNQAAAPPADAVNPPASNPVAAPSANPQNNPGTSAAAPPIDPLNNAGAQRQGPTQLQIIPNDPPANAAIPAPKGPTQLQAIPNSPPVQGNTAPQAPAQPQTNPGTPPAGGGNVAPSGPAPLQGPTTGSQEGGNSAPTVPGQPQNNIIAAQGDNGNPAAAHPAQPQNGMNNSPVDGNGNLVQPKPAQPQNGINNPPVDGNGNPVQAKPAQPNTLNDIPAQAGGPVAAPNPVLPPAHPNNLQGSGNNFAVAQSSAVAAVAFPVATPSAPLQLGSTQPLAVAGEAVQKAPDGGLLIGSQSIAQGSQATVAGFAISVGTDNVAIGSKTYVLPTASATTPVALGAPAPLSIGGQAAQYASNGDLLIGSQTIHQGSQATVAGSVISVGASNLNIGGSTFALPVPTAATRSGALAPPAVGGQPVQQAQSGGIVILGQTIAQGSQATVQGSVISVGPSNIVVGGSTYALPTPTDGMPLEVPATASIGGQAVQQLSNGGFVIAGQTLAPGMITTISGAVVSVGSSNIALGDTTYSFPNVASAAPLQTPAPLIIGGHVVQQVSNGAIVIGDQTLTPGAQTTILGTSISVGSSAVVVDGTTQAILPSYNTATGTTHANEIVLTQGAVVTEGGKVVTYSGPVISATEQGNSELLIGSRTLSIGPSMTASAGDNAALGGLILSALGANASFGAASSSLGGTPSGNAGAGPQSTIKVASAQGVGSRGKGVDWLFGRLWVLFACIAGWGIMMH